MRTAIADLGNAPYPDHVPRELPGGATFGNGYDDHALAHVERGILAGLKFDARGRLLTKALASGA